ncbi:hypothetical protein DIPPA_25405 [Diplonema papillatum]|nr:hypothetical protein DIPPA_25405 [Diplonema papillatum]KAJ9450259.1 hypothetical protein DIPPA_25405 [Diplonema papillatum]
MKGRYVLLGVVFLTGVLLLALPGVWGGPLPALAPVPTAASPLAREETTAAPPPPESPAPRRTAKAGAPMVPATPATPYPADLPVAVQVRPAEEGVASGTFTRQELYPDTKLTQAVTVTWLNETVWFGKYTDNVCTNAGRRSVGNERGWLRSVDLCAKNPVCQAVVCSGGDEYPCTLTSATCVLERKVLTSKRQPVAYVIHGRSVRSKNLLDETQKATASLRDILELKHATRRDTAAELALHSRQRHEYRLASLEHTQKTRTAIPLPAAPAPPAFVNVTKYDLRAFGHHVLVEPYRKIVIFLVPKVACSEFLRLYDRMLGYSDFDSALTGGAVHYRFDEPHRPRLLLSRTSTVLATRVLNDPSWVKACFFRDPKQRLLSAYLDKFVNSGYGRRYGYPNLTFDQLGEIVANDTTPPQGVGPEIDPHWRTQVLVGNLWKFLPLMDFVGWGNSKHARVFLERHGLWEEFGAHGWKAPTGFMQKAVTKDGHGTNAADKVAKYYTPGLEAVVDTAYSLDYHFFKELGLTEGGAPVTGRRVKVRGAHCYDHSAEAGGIACWPGKIVVG